MINVDYTPIRAVSDLATRAGEAAADQMQQELASRMMLAKMQHDTAMKEMEFQAQTQADAQFREEHFRRALAADQFRQGQLTLQEQYGYNIKLDRAKSEIDLQMELQKYQELAKKDEAVIGSIKADPKSSEEEKNKAIAIHYASTGRTEAARIQEPRQAGHITTISDPQGKAVNVWFDPVTGTSTPIGYAGRVVTPQATAMGMSNLEKMLYQVTVGFAQEPQPAQWELLQRAANAQGLQVIKKTTPTHGFFFGGTREDYDIVPLTGSQAATTTSSMQPDRKGLLNEYMRLGGSKTEEGKAFADKYLLTR